MATWYVVRFGWNGANQSALYRERNPKNEFESGFAELVAIVDANTKEEAISLFSGTVYNNQYLNAYKNKRSLKGLTEAARDF